MVLMQLFLKTSRHVYGWWQLWNNNMAPSQTEWGFSFLAFSSLTTNPCPRCMVSVRMCSYESCLLAPKLLWSCNSSSWAACFQLWWSLRLACFITVSMSVWTGQTELSFTTTPIIIVCPFLLESTTCIYIWQLPWYLSMLTCNSYLCVFPLAWTRADECTASRYHPEGRVSLRFYVVFFDCS